MSMTKTYTFPEPAYCGRLLKKGSDNLDVALMQTYLDALAAVMKDLLSLKADGKFGQKTEEAVKLWQKKAGLSADGIIGKKTWDSIVCTYNANYALGADTYPGRALRQGESGVSVEKMQRLHNQLSELYTALPRQKEDKKYGSAASAAARLFQKQFGLAADGIIGQKTWEAVIYVNSQKEGGTPAAVHPAYPGSALRTGSEGDSVRMLQSYLNRVSQQSGSSAPPLAVDGKFGRATRTGVMAFQAGFGLAVDGVAGRKTWARLVAEFNSTL